MLEDVGAIQIVCGLGGIRSGLPAHVIAAGWQKSLKPVQVEPISVTVSEPNLGG